MVIDRLVAVVGDQALMQSDVRAARLLSSFPVASESDDAVGVEQVVLRELMRVEVDRFAVPDPPASDVDARLDVLRGSTEAAAWAQRLREAGLSESRLRRHVADDLRMATYIDQRFLAAAQPTDLEVAQRAAADTGRPATATSGDAARAAIVAERRAALVDEWLAGLRRRASVRLVGPL
jgi:hypothetical protein